MKKKIAVLLAGTMMLAAVLSGCSASKGLKTDDLEISQYKGVEVEAKAEPQKITDEDVMAAIYSAMQQYSTENPADDYTVKNGDTVSIEYVGKVDGEAFDGGSTTEPTSLLIGSNSYIDGFEDSVIGHKKGDTFDWTGSFPEDYGNTTLAGKEATFTITLDAITQVGPELNDEMVQKLTTEVKTVDDYKKAVKESLEKQAQQTVDDNFNNLVWQTVLDNTEVKNYPSKDVNELYDMIINQYKSAAESSGLSYEDFIKAQMNQTVESFEKTVKESAQKSVKQNMVIDAIADKEKLEPTDKEYEKEYEKIAESYGYSDVETMKKAASEDDLKEIALGNIVKQWLADNAVQKDASK